MSVYELFEEERNEFRVQISDLERRNTKLMEELNDSHKAYEQLQNISTGFDKIWVGCINAVCLSQTELNELNQKLSSAGINIKLKFRDEKNIIKQFVDLLIEARKDISIQGKREYLMEQQELEQTAEKHTFAPMKVSVAVPTADGDVALIQINNIEELNNFKKNGVTKEMIETAEKLKNNDNIEIVGNVLQQTEVGRVYRHFKGKLYLVLDLATHSETGEQYVVYKALYGDCKTYIRPYLMFASGVDHEKYPDVQQEFRFQLVED